MQGFLELAERSRVQGGAIEKMFSFTEREFIPVMLGGDINTYSMARAFYEQYQVKSYIFGKYASGPSWGSRIIEYSADPAIETDEGFLRIVNGFAASHPEKKILLIGCGDSYVSLISKHKEELAGNIVAPYIDPELMTELQMKESFYALCDRYGIDHPGTIIYEPSMGTEFEMDFGYPCILKPSNGIMYWEHPFEGQNKVFTIASRPELESTIKKIYDAGYEDTLIIQDRIPGNDEYMYVLSSYSNSEGRVQMMCLGHVLLEEHTPHGLGNHAVIITEFNEELMAKARKLLEELRYVGFSNFDIKYDSRDGKFKFFEINTRLGRSNYYVTGAGFNVTRYVVEDYIYDRRGELELCRDEHLWMVVPKGVALKYVKQPENVSKIKELSAAGKSVNPIFMKGDLAPGRRFAMTKN